MYPSLARFLKHMRHIRKRVRNPRCRPQSGQRLYLRTLNFGSFSELEFSFALSPTIIIASLLFALGMGMVGGFTPAIRAARLKIVNALRER